MYTYYLQRALVNRFPDAVKPIAGLTDQTVRGRCPGLLYTLAAIDTATQVAGYANRSPYPAGVFPL